MRRSCPGSSRSGWNSSWHRHSSRDESAICVHPRARPGCPIRQSEFPLVPRAGIRASFTWTGSWSHHPHADAVMRAALISICLKMPFGQATNVSSAKSTHAHRTRNRTPSMPRWDLSTWVARASTMTARRCGIYYVRLTLRALQQADLKTPGGLSSIRGLRCVMATPYPCGGVSVSRLQQNLGNRGQEPTNFPVSAISRTP